MRQYPEARRQTTQRKELNLETIGKKEEPKHTLAIANESELGEASWSNVGSLVVTKEQTIT